jgi:DNA-binding response OmpR family regulator
LKLPFRTAGGSVGLSTGAHGAGPVHVLLIDDDDEEASLTHSLLAKVADRRYELDWVPTFSEGLASIAHDEHDAYLIDHELLGAAEAALAYARRLGPGTVIG